MGKRGRVMNRYIDADALIAEFPHDEDWDYPVNTNSYVVETINSASSIDIVFCKECKYGSDNKVYGCSLINFNTDEWHRMYANDFCSRGERKESK